MKPITKKKKTHEENMGTTSNVTADTNHEKIRKNPLPKITNVWLNDYVL